MKVALFLGMALGALQPLSSDGIGATMALAQDGDRVVAFVSDSDGHALLTIDADTSELLARTELDAAPAQLIVGDRVYVAVPGSDEVVALRYVSASSPLRREQRVSLPREPVGLAFSGGGIFVTSRAAAMVTHLDHRGEVLSQARVPRDPYGIAVREGEPIVSHIFGTPPGVGGQGYAIVSAGDALYAPTVSEVGAIAKLSPEVELSTGTRAPLHRDCLLPRAAVFDAARQHILVACLGVDAVKAYDLDGNEAASFDVAEGPTALALTPDRHVLVWSQFARAITTIDLNDPQRASRRSMSSVSGQAEAIRERVAGGCALEVGHGCAAEQERRDAVHRVGHPRAVRAVGRGRTHDAEVGRANPRETDPAALVVARVVDLAG